MTDAYTELRAQIVSGEYMPGERLPEADLAKKLGTGRAAVRTALTRLEQDGLVEHERNRGARVRRITIEEGIEILEAHSSLEALAAGYAARRATPEDVADLQAIIADIQRDFDTGDYYAVSEHSAVLHARVLQISGHATAQRLCKTLHSHTVRFQFRTSLVPGRPGYSAEELAAIVDAITASDPRAAEAAVLRNIRNTIEAFRVNANRVASWA